MVGGQGVGQSVRQTTPCDAWSYDNRFQFKDLTPGVEMTLRASAPGWNTLMKTVIPHVGVQTGVIFTLSKADACQGC